jgi:starch synthase
MFKVLFAASEATPFVQTGGLAEVAGSLPFALAALGCDVRLAVPAYRAVLRENDAYAARGALRLAHYPQPAPLWSRPLARGVELWLIGGDAYFDRSGGPYLDEQGADWPDNPQRFAYFSHALTAAATGALPDGWRPDIVHAHDWQTALVPFLLAQRPARPATVFTLHNLAFRGLCGRDIFAQLHLPETAWHYEGLEFYGQCALLKGGLVYADRLTTVSPTYAREIQHPAHGYGLDGVLRSRSDTLRGILNGIDPDLWNPASDPALAAPYDATRLGDRRHNKRALQATFGLPQDDRVLVAGAVTRLTEQKGIDLVLGAIPGLLEQPIQWIFVGNGEPGLEAWIRRLAAAHPDRVAARIGFDVELSHRMFGGLDVCLMPSRFEPCGLSQLYAQRYGTVPIVRHTGGLADSVRDADGRETGTGFVFEPATVEACAHTILRALRAYQDPAYWLRLQREGMAQDFSWAHRAGDYLDVYSAAAESVSGASRW